MSSRFPIGVPTRYSPGTSVLSVLDRKSTRLNSSHGYISYAVFCLKKKKKEDATPSSWFDERTAHPVQLRVYAHRLAPSPIGRDTISANASEPLPCDARASSSVHC